MLFRSETEPDRGARLQVAPDPTHKIPVVYGSAHLGGIITDAVLTNNNTTMYYCITLCEQTGTVFSTGKDSRYSLNEVYWDDKRIVFQDDGVTAAYMVDRDSNIDYSIADLVKIYFFQSSYQSTDPGYTITSYMANTAAVPHYSVPIGTGSKNFFYYQGQTNFGSNNTTSRLVSGDRVIITNHANTQQTMTGTVTNSNIDCITANITSYTGTVGSLVANATIRSYISQQPVFGYSLTSRVYGYDIMPGWDSTYTMPDLVFAIVKVDYNKEKNLTGMPSIQFKMKNTMTLPGDCLYDYMLNTRYGVGLSPEEIKSV